MHVASGSRSQSERLILLILCYFILDHANLIILHEAALAPLFEFTRETYLVLQLSNWNVSDEGLFSSGD